MYLQGLLVTVVICGLVGSGAGQKQSRPRKGCTLPNGKKAKINEQVDLPGQCKLNKCVAEEEWTISPCGYLGVPNGWSSTPEDTSATAKYPACCAQLVPPLNITPDVLDTAPGVESMTINYGPRVSVEGGNKLTPTQVKEEPQVNFSFWAQPRSSYLLLMVDPDASSRQNSVKREFLHWMVANIPGSDVKAGDVVVEYVGAGPARRTGLHRYVFLLYKQPGILTITEEKLSKYNVGWRDRFSAKNFAKKYRLGDPESVNVFRAKYDNYVPQIQSQLGQDDTGTPLQYPDKKKPQGQPEDPNQNYGSQGQPQYNPNQNYGSQGQPQYNPNQNNGPQGQPQYNPNQNYGPQVQPQYNPNQNNDPQVQPQYNPNQNYGPQVQPQYNPNQYNGPQGQPENVYYPDGNIGPYGGQQNPVNPGGQGQYLGKPLNMFLQKHEADQNG